MRVSLRSLSLSILISIAVSPAAAAPPGSGTWEPPSCRAVVGASSVTFTADEGATLAPTILRQDPMTYTFGVAALEAPNLMLAEHQGTILRSANAGCRWTSFATVGTSLLRLVPGDGGIAYAWGFFQGPEIWRIDALANPRDPGRLTAMPPLPAGVLVVAIDPADGSHLRAVGTDAQIYDLPAGGTKWAPVGSPAPTDELTLVYFAAVNPSSLDHVIVGMSSAGVWTTTDGGGSWTQATGLSAAGGPRNAFSGTFSSADASEAFVMSLDIDESDAGAPSQGRHVYRSGDGGHAFVPVVDNGGAITLTNGPLLVAHPTAAGVLYFTFGSRFLDPPGTFLYRYDHAAGQTTWNFTTSALGIRAIDFNRAEAGVMYLGLER